MKKFKQRFNDDPMFATYVMVIGGITAAALLKSVAKTIESSAYAYRASKM